MAAEPMSHSEFLRNRRPERYSDSAFKQVTEVDRSQLEYHLASLTSRNQERDFENFVRILCSREICPNLVSQSGPTGGGDAKVDTETYPVSIELAMCWIVCQAQQASTERWAFAFSAQANWRQKLRLDVEKIVQTQRGYSKAIFVTSQTVSAKKSAELQDSLQKQYGIDVRIYDRNWIIDRISHGHHDDIVVSELKLTTFERKTRVLGVNDQKREERLAEIEERVRQAALDGDIGYNAVDDVIDAADCIRGMERSQNEVYGSYERAVRFADKHGTLRQRIEAHYQWAWTAAYWYDHFEMFYQQYGAVAELIVGTHNVYDLEQFFSLSTTSITASEENVQFASEHAGNSDRLKRELQRMSKQESYPISYLEATCLLLQYELLEKTATGQEVGDTFVALRSVVERSEPILSFPLDALWQSINEVSALFENVPTFHDFFELLVDVQAKRKGEIASAVILLQRGLKQRQQNKYPEAIATIGRALTKLYKEESSKELVIALYYSGLTYANLGLYWAARGTLLTAARICLDQRLRYGGFSRFEARIYRQLKYVELSLGRLPHLLAWHAIEWMFISDYMGGEDDQVELLDPENKFDALLSGLIFRCENADLRHLEYVPDVLDRSGLANSADALLYILGYSERLSDFVHELGRPLDEYIEKIAKLRINDDELKRLHVGATSSFVLSTKILGCTIHIECVNQQSCIDIAETLLAIMENMVATSVLHGAYAFEPMLRIAFKPSHFESSISCIGDVRNGGPYMEVRYPIVLPYSHESNNELLRQIMKLALEGFSRVLHFGSEEAGSITERVEREDMINRALTFGTGLGIQQSMFPNASLGLLRAETVKHYPNIRTTDWSVDLNETVTEQQNPEVFPYDAAPDDVRESFNRSTLSHQNITTVSVIRVHQWDEAKWHGVVVGLDSQTLTLHLGLIFEHLEPARAIFRDWRTTFGPIDKDRQLRLSIVKGVDRQAPFAYTVGIGSNLTRSGTATMFQIVSRHCRVDPPSSQTLEFLIEWYPKVKSIRLEPAALPRDGSSKSPPDIDSSLSIDIAEINFLNAWEIGLASIDAGAIDPDSTPVIPPDISNAPILALLESLRGRNR